MSNLCLHGTLFHNTAQLEITQRIPIFKSRSHQRQPCKGGLIQTDFHFGSNLQIAVANNDPEHYPPT